MSTPATSPLPPWELFGHETRCIVHNFKAQAVQRMLDFDFLVRRPKPSVAAITRMGGAGFHKVFFGAKEILLPCYGDVIDAARSHPDATVLVNFASSRSAFASTMLTIEQIPSIRTIVVIAEGVPERDAVTLVHAAAAKGVTVIGPATVGGIAAGAFKVGDTAGTIENIIRCKLYRPGSVGFVSKSGGMSNESYALIARAADGVREGIAVGGDAFPGTTLCDHAVRLAQNPAVRMIVILGEVGSADGDEHAVAAAITAGKFNGKPVIAWVAGTCAPLFAADNVQFGHAGARADESGAGSAEAKNKALKAAGAVVPASFDGLEEAVRATFAALPPLPAAAADGTYPTDAEAAEAQFVLGSRKATSFMTTISDDRGDEPSYCGMPVSDIVKGGQGVGDVIALLWLKRALPPWATKFLELCIVLTADHGPCVSGAHNTIVASRAGKDLVSSLCSGLLTIGPRFGGALDESAATWRDGLRRGLTAAQLVEAQKAAGKNIAGIGHKVRSIHSPDKRVLLLKDYAGEHFPGRRHLEYALAVEAITTKKGPTLILNVDGCIAAMFLDMLDNVPSISPDDAATIVECGTLNGIFVLARSIGLIGHTLDQKRLKEPLYRHPRDDVMFVTDYV